MKYIQYLPNMEKEKRENRNWLERFIIKYSGNGAKRLLLGYLLIALLLWLLSVKAEAQEVDRTPHIHGTVRGKYEWQTTEKEHRFEVRNARVSVSGDLTKCVSYKAEIDFCDEGKIKMLDAYTRFKWGNGWQFTIGQMRVPFTIDAHRSPHQQYFANRSFIAKQVGNVRDVGAQMAYSFDAGIPFVLTAGVFNGSGLTNQKDFWTKSINFSAKLQAEIPCGINLLLSAQKIKPDAVNILMYDGGINYHAHGLHVEAEYLIKTYEHKAFNNVHAVDAFVSYDIPVRRKEKTIMTITPLVRYDYMSDHSDGKRYLDGAEDPDGSLKINDYRRSRLTGGVTLSLNKPFISDIRINYEKYFYSDQAKPKTSEHDKLVIEVMTRF